MMFNELIINQTRNLINCVKDCNMHIIGNIYILHNYIQMFTYSIVRFEVNSI